MIYINWRNRASKLFNEFRNFKITNSKFREMNGFCSDDKPSYSAILAFSLRSNSFTSSLRVSSDFFKSFMTSLNSSSLFPISLEI